MSEEKKAKQTPIRCWKVDTTILAASDAVPGMFASGTSMNDAAQRYKQLVNPLGPMPGASYLRPSGAASVPAAATRGLYLGFPADSNFGDQWVYKALQQRLASLELVYQAETLEDCWTWVLPSDAFSFFLLGGGTLINQQPLFFKDVKFGLDSGVPLLCFGTGVGDPERWGDHLKPWVELLRSFRYVGVRGPRAHKLLAGAGLTNHHTVGDPCLLDDLRFIKGTARSQPRVALDLSFAAIETEQTITFRYQLLHLLKTLEEARKITVVLYSTWNVYEPWVRALVRQAFGTDKPVISIHGDITEFPEVDIAIAYRLHAAAIPLLQGIPVFMVRYEDKCADFAEYAGLASWLIEPEFSGYEKIRNYFDGDLIRKIGQGKNEVCTAILQAKVGTDRSFKDFRASLE